jgi:two-component system, cell cycle sensor histidine kinase and response regulator CckA
MTDLCDALPAVMARGGQIHQIVLNLVINASDAIKDYWSDSYCHRARYYRPRPSCYLARRSGRGVYVQLEVSDTGSGMSEETQARIFDPFFSTRSAGRGLGLSVVHGIVRDLQGTIRVSSELGKGSTFQVLLPSVDTAAGGASGESRAMNEALSHFG